MSPPEDHDEIEVTQLIERIEKIEIAQKDILEKIEKIASTFGDITRLEACEKSIDRIAEYLKSRK